MVQGTLFDEKKEKYLLVISPPLSWIKKIRETRQKFFRLIGLPYIDSTAHITIYEKIYEGDYRNFVIHQVEDALKDIAAFEVELHQWMLFENKYINEKAIVLKVDNPVPIKELTKSVSRKMKKAFQNNTPHLTLIKDIFGEHVERLAPVLNDIQFKIRFKCDKLTLLRCEEHNGGWTKYENLGEFLLK